ncbi:MAG: hypothetical protein V4702_04555 [Patescibacteria group bacterium]
MGMYWAERHVRKFGVAEIEHLSTIRRLRSYVRKARDIDPVSQAILGLTNSQDLLEEVEKQAAQIAELQGEPAICIESRSSSWPMANRAAGGIIAGELCVGSSSFDEKFGAGRSELVVPVTSLRRYRRTYTNDFEVMPNESPSLIPLVTIEYDELGNDTRQPGGDFEVTRHVLLLGQEAIVGSELYGPEFEQLLALCAD